MEIGIIENGRRLAVRSSGTIGTDRLWVGCVWGQLARKWQRSSTGTWPTNEGLLPTTLW